MKVAFELPPAQAARLRTETARLGSSPEDLPRAAPNDLLGVPDPAFTAAAHRVIEKNQDLDKRLA